MQTIGNTIDTEKAIERKPKWDKWQLFPEIEIWKAVALSLDIEPDKVKLNSQGWMGAAHPFKESEEFTDRLDVILANVCNASYFPTPMSKADRCNHSYKKHVRLAEFVHFAVDIAKWNVPSKLVALRATPTAEVEGAVVPVSAPLAAFHANANSDDGMPPALPTPVIAAAFDGIHWDADKWSKALGDGRTVWLKKARKSKGQRGRDPATWNPITIALNLKDKNILWAKLDAVFKKTVMKEWRTQWDNATELRD